MGSGGLGRRQDSKHISFNFHFNFPFYKKQTMTISLNSLVTFLASLRRALLATAVVAGAIATTGCATPTGPVFQTVAAAPAGQGQVYLYSKYFFGGGGFDVTLNKQPVGKLASNSFMQFALPTGTHVFTVQPGPIAKTYEQTINVVEGQALFFQFELPPIFLTNAFQLGSNITPRTAEQALVDLKELKAVR